VPYLGSLKGTAAATVDESIRPHEGHCLAAEPRLWIEKTAADGHDELTRVFTKPVDIYGIRFPQSIDDAPLYQDAFLILRCRDCDVDILELDE
jgi:hypothetical protein